MHGLLPGAGGQTVGLAEESLNRELTAAMDLVSIGVTKSQFRELRKIVEQGAEVKTKVSGRVTLLMLASEWGDVETARFALHRGVVVDARDTSGMTALLKAAAHGHRDIVQLLLAHGADPEVRDSTLGKTALLMAVTDVGLTDDDQREIAGRMS